MALPNSTYRIQLNKEFNLTHLRMIIPYLHELGISTIYASPLTEAIKGSQHGYDVSDPSAINEEIGTEPDLRDISNRLADLNMTWLQDIVPNHMACDVGNPWLADVLERGPVSQYYRYFDLEVHARTRKDSGGAGPCSHMMVPILGRPLSECVQDGELTLDLRENGFFLCYFETAVPVAPHLYRWIMTANGNCSSDLAIALEKWEASIGLPLIKWKEYKQTWVRETLFGQDGFPASNTANEPRPFITRILQWFRATPALIRKLAESQYYLLTDSRLSNTRIDYRRFFTVNSLICLRMEDEAVFNTWHHLPLQWYRQGMIQGLRIDHIDGLAAPRRYIDRLRAAFGDDCYIVAEKILAPEEQLPSEWNIAGTTGYEFLSAAGQVLTDAEGSRVLLTFYREHIANMDSYPDLVFNKKIGFLCRYMQGELDNLLLRLNNLPLLAAGKEDAARLREALGTLMASFPVYRIYPDENFLNEVDRHYLSGAFSLAATKRTDLRRELDYFQRILELSADLEKRQQQLAFLTRLMQFTGPLAAKGVEDTTFYVFNPYISHNEVGDTPAVAGISVEDFHHQMSRRMESSPHSLNASTTHDTKRGEDSRIRLNFLSTVPEEWIGAVRRWQTINKESIKMVNGRRAPSLNDEYLIYQALIGGLPFDTVITDEFRERFSKYLTKAMSEAKTETRWDAPDPLYENACLEFASSLLAPGSDFLKDFCPFAANLIEKAVPASLSQLLLKLTAPGIPDIYQGAECWDTSFVDPDNRRPVDFTRRAHLLKSLHREQAKGKFALSAFLSEHAAEGVSKLFVLQQTLNFRNRHPLLFSKGEYIPGPILPSHLAFIRHYEEEWLLVIVPLICRKTFPEKTISIPLPEHAPHNWTNIFTGDIARRCPDLSFCTDGSLLPVALYTAVSGVH